MKKLKHILLFVTVTFALLAMTQTAHAAAEHSQQEQEHQLSSEGVHLLAFLQPESVHHVISNSKTGPTNICKSVDALAFEIALFRDSKSQKLFVIQDINRCENVSILLFPFHIFW